MKELQTITQITRAAGVSTRTLRYYERIGLLQSERAEGYAYRVYSEEACTRLKQIILLRKLRVPLKQIAALLGDSSAVNAIELFMQNISELDEEIASLGTIRDILQALVDKLRESASVRIGDHLLSDKKIMALVAPLSLNKFALKEADERLNKLTDSDVRIIYIPPMTVASSHYVGEDCEMHAGAALDKFVRESGLLEIKPDARHFGFNNPMQCAENVGLPSTGYEMWVSIPEDWDVPAPLRKIRFHGGLYAAHMILMGNFEQWRLFGGWLQGNGRYESDWDAVRCTPHTEGMDSAMEEQLNFFNNAQNPRFDHSRMQLDLLLPIREKE
jgi:DNA-binding transcriptional MerR regulator